MYGTYASDASTLRSSVVTPPTRNEPSPFRYEVQHGDTLKSIAEKLNTTEKRLRVLNPLLVSSNNNNRSSKNHHIKLYPGQQLVVEEAHQESLPPPPQYIDNGWGQMHVVCSGETLKSIALQYNTLEEYIRQDNRNYFPTGERGILFTGQMLHIRHVNIGQFEPEEETEVIPKYTSHLVTKTDTFESICTTYNITYSRLLQLNRGCFPMGTRAELMTGMSLIVPDVQAQEKDKLRNVAEVKLTKQIHEVQVGETPHSIAEYYHMSYDELRECNRVYFPKGYRGEIRPGYKLVVRRIEGDRIEDGHDNCPIGEEENYQPV